MAHLPQISSAMVFVRRAGLARLVSLVWLGLMGLALIAALPDAMDSGDDATVDSDLACDYQVHVPSADGPDDVLAVPEIGVSRPALALLGSLPSPTRCAPPLAPPLRAARCRGDPTLGLS